MSELIPITLLLPYLDKGFRLFDDNYSSNSLKPLSRYGSSSVIGISSDIRNSGIASYLLEHKTTLIGTVHEIRRELANAVLERGK